MEPMKVYLCKRCIEELKDYNPYIVPVEITEVSIMKCDNYTIGGEFITVNR